MGRRLRRRAALFPRRRVLQVVQAHRLPPLGCQEGQGGLLAGRRGPRLPALHDPVQHGQRQRPRG